MVESPISNPFDEDDADKSDLPRHSTDMDPLDADSNGRTMAGLILAAGGSGCCLLAFVVILFYRPDVQPLVDRYFPSPTATLTRTPTSTPSNTFTPTITPTPYVLVSPPEGVNVFEDSFDGESKTWDEYYGGTTVRINNGRLILRSSERQYIGMTLCTDCPVFHDTFYFQSEVYLPDETNEFYGLVFCSPGYGDLFYGFEINSVTQMFYLTKHSGSGWMDLISRRYTDAIHRYPETNTVAVYFDQGKIDLFVNEEHVATYQDKTPPKCRQIGFIINAGAADLIADNVFAYKLPNILSPTSTP